MEIALFAENSLLYYLLVAVLESSKEVKSVSIVWEFEQLIELLSQKNVDIVMIDMTSNILRNVEYFFAIKSDFVNAKFIFFADHYDEKLVSAFAAYEPHGIFFQNDDYSSIFDGIINIHSGNKSNSPQIDMLKINSFRDETISIMLELTNREKQILNMIAKGISNSLIAEKLNISEETVKTHRKNLREKLNIENYENLMKFIIEHRNYFDK